MTTYYRFQRHEIPLLGTDDCAMVFRPMPGELAVMYFAKSAGPDDLLSGCELGEPVSTKVFQ